jgi:hypothetical protein
LPGGEGSARSALGTFTLAPLAASWYSHGVRLCGRWLPDRRGNDVSRHEKQDDKDKYTGNGYKPGPIPGEDPGGKHGKPADKDDQDDRDDKGEEK